MFQQVDKYLKNQLERIVFIELKENTPMKNEQYKMLKGIPVPILVNELAEIVKKQETEQTISLAAMARAMILLLGLDNQFKYIQEYKDFLYAFDAHIEDYIVYEGLKAADQKEFYTALIYFRALMLFNEENINGLFNYARCCQDIAYQSQERDVEQDFSNEAHQALELLVEQHPDFALGYYHLGFYYANQRLFKKAQLTWEKALKLQIDEEKEREILVQLDSLKNHIQYEEGYSLILNNEPKRGLEKLIPLEEKHAEWWNLLFFIGLGYRQLNQYDQAIEYFLKILRINPTQVDTLNELGICYGSLQDYINAEKYLKKALQFKPDDSEILCNLGMVYMEQGNLKSAREVFEQSIRENPEDEITIMCLAKLKSME
ncbi:tetratricopeptide (TPR) repeat protein [Anaerosolibacter carboniphilus]|uniref:Tetratricopeptide (TPR) repeat protein n=1 Tax=Anaerosolibacter carboniphilus TaxID=1417629 RepID=A0A841L757_9FIRM|nr:tetratricopeptide repeat protein [Anaerosolibacter carboniphilus]MBB6218229.1 tetratricopeptide (TPR) repeat protein [Anaerosolibacter carboniphilus]